MWIRFLEGTTIGSHLFQCLVGFVAKTDVLRTVFGCLCSLPLAKDLDEGGPCFF